jgi:hypothetical protein
MRKAALVAIVVTTISCVETGGAAQLIPFLACIGVLLISTNNQMRMGGLA